MKQIWVKEKTKTKLVEIKNNYSFSSFDEVIELGLDLLSIIFEAFRDEKTAEELYEFVSELMKEHQRRLL